MTMPTNTTNEELVKQAKHILLAIEMCPDKKGKLEVLLHVLEERRLAIIAARIEEVEATPEIQVLVAKDGDHVKASLRDFSDRVISHRLARLADLEAQLHPSHKENIGNE